MSNAVTTWFLQQTAPTDLRPSDVPDGDVRIVRAEVPSPEFSRFLYTAVGGHHRWNERLPWTYAQWEQLLARPGTETWVAYEKGTPAGFVELQAREEGSVEIVSFGLLPAFQGRRIGGHLLSYGTARAWDLADRWPGLAPTQRVWLHTCSLDGPHAMGNYQRRGFAVFDTTVAEHPEAAEPAPGSWPGAHP
ncbi:GNAT family N-acetyltransferase [Streptomyces sp. NPDC052236]|uniref:GNAT family N-acetyltransferase n=1 Tax=Streptomyces sp. NPDC052236 TaxID=3365686 RepID=UPI0037D52084